MKKSLPTESTFMMILDGMHIFLKWENKSDLDGVATDRLCAKDHTQKGKFYHVIDHRHGSHKHYMYLIPLIINCKSSLKVTHWIRFNLLVSQKSHGELKANASKYKNRIDFDFALIYHNKLLTRKKYAKLP